MDIFNNAEPVACIARSDAIVDKLVKASGEMSSGKNFVLLLKDSSSVRRRLLPSFMNAYLRYTEHFMRAESLQKEVLLFAAGTMNINKAIRSAAIDTNAKFIVFASNRKLMNEFIITTGSAIMETCRLEIDKNIAKDVAITGLSGDS